MSTEDNIIIEFADFIFIYQMLGYCPIYTENSKFSKRTIELLTFIHIFIISIYCVFVFMYRSHILFTVKITVGYLADVVKCTTIFMCFFIFAIQSYQSRNKQELIWKNLGKFDNLIRTLPYKKNYKWNKNHLRTFSRKFYLITIVNVLSVVMYFSYNMVAYRQQSINYILAIQTPAIITRIHHLQQMLYIEFISTRLDVLAVQLECLRYQPDNHRIKFNKNSKKQVSATYKGLNLSFNILYDTVELIKKSFGWSALAYMAHIFLYLFFNCFFMTKAIMLREYFFHGIT